MEAEFFGTTSKGADTRLFTISGGGISMKVSDYGATITSLIVTNGLQQTDVVLGFDNVSAYETSIDLPAPPYFGAVIGRWAGRIDRGVFTLNGTRYQLDPNNNGHFLHGGRKGFSQQVWRVAEVRANAITFEYDSASGEEGMPGELSAKVTYSLAGGALEVNYEAVSSEDTPINMTQHSYFNLDGHDADLSSHEVFIDTKKVLETLDMIPTGRFLDTKSTPFDFGRTLACPTTIDASFVLKNQGPAASLYSTRSKLKMSVFTDQPSVHIYVGGNCFGQIKGKCGVNYHPFSGICFEAQNFPDSVNHPHFPDPILRKGETYRQKTTFKFESES